MRGIGEINENKINKFKKMAMAGIAPMCLKSDSDKILAGGLAKGSSASRGGGHGTCVYTGLITLSPAEVF